MKVCKECNKEKELSLFYGVQGECKECTKKRVKDNSQRVGSKYDFSEIGVVRVIYKTQKRHNKSRGYGDMPYTKKELSTWLYSNHFKSLYDSWVRSGWIKSKKPSIDRINDFKGYSFSNIKLGTWASNIKHQHQDITNGTGTSGLRCKLIYKYDGVKNLIATYVSYSSAARDMGYSLEYQIKKQVKCRSGYYWSYVPF
tara:strand:+ start:4911 stop:5504 length:594 start_codon:yes stop_codon:yes gene_type:complete